MNILFLHGLESGPHGTKYQALSAAFGPGIIAPDCTGINDPEERLQKVAEALEDAEGPFICCGSSFGGLLALMVADKYPERCVGLVLCCPALIYKYRDHWTDLPAPTCTTTVIHGMLDTVVPLVHSRNWVRHRCPAAALVVVPGGHRLGTQEARIVAEVGLAMKVALTH